MPRKLYISILLLLGTLFMTSSVIGQVTYSDTFSSVSYSNNDGTNSFSGGWVETNETTDPASGRILINSNQLRFQNLDSRYIERSLDLSAAVSATLTLDYNRTNGNESILVQLWDGGSYNTVATLAGSGSVNYNLAANEMSAASSIRFITGSGGWGNSETIFVDNVLFTAVVSPAIAIDDISVDEGAGTATFTATHVGLNAAGPFTVNYQTADATATAGSDYTATSGVLSFNGTVGDTEQIVVSITDDIIFEADETYSIVFIGTSDPSVDISNTGTGTITDNEVVLGNTPLTLFREFDGYMDYTSTAGTLRTQPNTVDPCAITTTSSNTLSAPIPAGATIEGAYLYWSHSGANMDSQVTFEGNTVDGNVGYTTSILGLSFYGFFSDVTSIIQGIPDPSTNVYDFSGLTIDNTGNYCSYNVVLGGWALMIFYSDPSLPASTINLYQGFDGNQNSSSTFSLSGFFAIGSSGSKTTALSWEGDQTLANNESLQFTTPLSGTNLLVGDGDNDGITANNPFNSTHFDNTILPNLNNTASHGVDLDTYDVSAFILPGETSATTQVNVGQDYVIMNAVVLKVPSNLITGRVFEDVNYGGGAGRNYAAASGVGVSGATVELYDSGGSLVDTQTTDANGIYVFAGMVDGTYSVRVVNETVTSSRPGGGACGDCLPVQTFKTEYIASSLVERTNEVGGTDPTATDPSAGTLTGAQSVASVTIVSEGVAGLDFGFNFNTIVNTNIDGQGSLEQFILNSNGLGETGLDIEANAIFDPGVGEDTSVFMIPPTGDALGRTADVNYSGGYFAITLTAGDQFSKITDDNTHIDGRTQTAYSGDSNSGTEGAGGNNVGVGVIALPNYERPEIQIYEREGDPITIEGNNFVLRNTAVYSDARSAILVDGGTASLYSNFIGVGADGIATADLDNGVEIKDGTVLIDGNYITLIKDAGILIDGGTSTIIQNNHITGNGVGNCGFNIEILDGTGISILQNLIENAEAVGLEADRSSGSLSIAQNTITGSGQDTGCNGGEGGVGIRLGGSNSSLTGNLVYSNGNAGIVVSDGSGNGNLISQNAIYANGTTADALGIDLDDSGNYGDGVTLNDNGDTDAGPNGLLNFPIITAAYMSGANLVIKGWSRPGATIEVFLTDINEGTATTGDNELGLSTDYGEGQIYLGTVVEGSGADLDAGSSSYTDVDGNTDNTNRFHFSFAVPPIVTMGDVITATATLGNSTSEFSPMSILKVQSVITNRRITYRVNQD